MQQQLYVYIWNASAQVTTIVTAESYAQAKEIISKVSVRGDYPGLPTHIIAAPKGAELEFSEEEVA